MSDRPSELEFKLNNVVLAVNDVVEWLDLGLQLGLPSATLRLIAANPNTRDIKSQRLAMLSEWFKYDTAASWEKLAAALATIGENVVAANVRSRFMKATTPPRRVVDASNQDENTCEEMTRTVLRKIRSQFASLQVKVRSAMEAQQVKVSDVHQFLVSFFQSECCIPEAPDLTKLFNIITEAKLWRYDHYGPLEELAEEFLPDENPARKLVSEYKDQLSGFYIATKIVDFIDLNDSDDDCKEESDDDSKDDTQQSLPPRESKKLYRKLKVTLNLDRTIKLSDLTMSYVYTLWKALIREFNLPPLTAILKKIASGSVIITWLVPPQVSTVIAACYSKALRFYQQHNIVEVQLDGCTLYHEDWIGDDSNTALIQVCRDGRVETATVLLDHGANVNYQNESGESALCCASDAGETECVKVLVKYGAQVDLLDEEVNTALIKACAGGHVEIAQVLLDHGANVDHQNCRGETALIWACIWERTEIVNLLLKAGAKTDIQEKYSVTAFYFAACYGYVGIVQMLIDYGAAVDLGRFNVDGRTGLMKASERGHTNTVQVLLEANADPNITDEYGDTALHWAARGGHIEVVKMLVKYGAAVDTRNKWGETALHKAVLGGHVEVVKTLVDHGAAVDVRNKELLTAFEVAKGHGHQAVCEVLEQYTKQETRTELTEEQRESIYQRLLKMAERIFLKEQVKKREEQQKKEHHHQREEREKRSLWNRLTGRQNRPGHITGTAPAAEK